MSGADTVWILVATALVLFMTLPGLALFYGGLVRSRNVLSVFMHTYAIACLMSILWFSFGYSIAFGDLNSFWGGFGKSFLSGVHSHSLIGTLPEILFFSHFK
jgi:Amt family ammonium transporter